MLMSNIVSQKNLRKVQLEVLEALSNALIKSFGPYGSNTEIIKDGALNMYTKDGYTILKNILFKGPIESAVKTDIEEIARYVARTVGDGTTSAILLSYLIFKDLCENESDGKSIPAITIDTINTIIDNLKDIIKNNSKEATLEDLRNIAYISSNGSDDIADKIYNIYKEYGTSVYIDTLASTGVDDLLKIYDGLTIDAGFCDAVFVNDTTRNISSIKNPNIYVFEDPIDTPEMIGFLDTIIFNNIIITLNDDDSGSSMIPTVIVAPRLSRDMSTFFDQLIDSMAKSPMKLPLLMVTNISSQESIMDMAKLCNAPLIKKYIDPRIQETDIEAGKAPTPDTIVDFHGSAELVEADSVKTKFIKPELMCDENGEYTEMFSTLISFLKSELKRAQDEGEDADTIGSLKKRINSLTGNLVEYYVGGINASDRDAKLHLIEDAVLNCRSAAINGVGYGANFEGARAVTEYIENLSSDTTIENAAITRSIVDAYNAIFTILFDPSNKETNFDLITEAIDNGCPKNLRTNDYDHTVKSSIESDIMILDAISRIIGIMYTCNQTIVPTPLHNTYYSEDEITK